MNEYSAEVNRDGISIGSIELQDGEWVFVPDGQPVSYDELIRIAKRIKKIEEALNNE